MSLPFIFKICIYHWIWIEFFIWSLQYSIVQSVFSMVAFLFSRGSSQPRDWTQSPTLQVDSLPAEPQGKPRNTGVGSLSLLQGSFPTQESSQCPCSTGGFFTNWAIREAQPICKIRSNVNRFFWFFLHLRMFLFPFILEGYFCNVEFLADCAFLSNFQNSVPLPSSLPYFTGEIHCHLIFFFSIGNESFLSGCVQNFLSLIFSRLNIINHSVDFFAFNLSGFFSASWICWVCF